MAARHLGVAQRHRAAAAAPERDGLVGTDQEVRDDAAGRRRHPREFHALLLLRRHGRTRAARHGWPGGGALSRVGTSLRCAAMLAKVTVRAPSATRSYALAPGRLLVLGRSADCDLSVAEASVSRRHCTVVVLADAIEIADLGAAHGVVRQGRKVAQARLAVGDAVRLGDATLAFDGWLAADATAKLPPAAVSALADRGVAPLADAAAGGEPSAANAAPPTATAATAAAAAAAGAGKQATATPPPAGTDAAGPESASVAMP
ncbi:MAG: FHA domain-containing protein, partial [Planctomycetes bacterium]|nr:FHA domain-containing protein [Planctomycetota bacterium]